MFALLVNFVPCLMAFLLFRILKTGVIPIYVGLMKIKRRDLPVQYFTFLGGFIFVMLITIVFAAYLDYNFLLSR